MFKGLLAIIVELNVDKSYVLFFSRNLSWWINVFIIIVMRRLSIYLLFLFFVIASSSKSQYLCDNEYKFINRQKKKIRKKCAKQVNDWLLINDDLNIPKIINLSRLKFLTKEKEKNKWLEIDSLFCIKKDAKYIKKAKRRLLELKLVVYDIRIEFNYVSSSNSEIVSVLNFEFDIEGNMIRAAIRRKKGSPYSKTPLH